MSSILGYILSGNIDEPGSLGSPFHSFNVGSTHLLRVKSEIVRPVSEDVKKVFGVEKNNFSSDDIQACENFEKTTKFENGRYTVRLPFKDHKETIGDNYAVTRSRLKSLVLNTFQNNEHLLCEYNNIVDEQRNEGNNRESSCERST